MKKERFGKRPNGKQGGLRSSPEQKRWGVNTFTSDYYATISLNNRTPQKIISRLAVVAFSFADELMGLRGQHSEEKIWLTIQMLNQQNVEHERHHEGKPLFEKVIFLVADELQALNDRPKDRDTSEEELQKLREAQHEKALKWIEKIKYLFEQLDIPYEIHYWRDWIGGKNRERFIEYRENLTDLRTKNHDFNDCVKESSNPYLTRYLKEYNKKPENRNRKFSNEEMTKLVEYHADYPVEETAVVQLMAETLGPFNLYYPTELNNALNYLKNHYKDVAQKPIEFTVEINGKILQVSQPFQSFHVEFLKQEKTYGYPGIAWEDESSDGAEEDGEDPSPRSRALAIPKNNKKHNALNSSSEGESELSTTPPDIDAFTLQAFKIVKSDRYTLTQKQDMLDLLNLELIRQKTTTKTVEEQPKSSSSGRRSSHSSPPRMNTKKIDATQEAATPLTSGRTSEQTKKPEEKWKEEKSKSHKRRSSLSDLSKGISVTFLNGRYHGLDNMKEFEVGRDENSGKKSFRSSSEGV